ncbi:hypothetical protein EXE59_22805 [Nocardioides eburneiflavus]|uniref:Uncharacterized protein n=1 Tax=Nocardioides eburneiflavus TaxID=2518372 RepID=A0A4Z1CNB6_9ACTN|nr:hypothetical protein [Nocardioides eburneiflavus]TGN66467.1 hypothetical protein EXE59_22805 [Nocardioides eburneiflavus]
MTTHVSPSRPSRSAYARWAGRAVVLTGAPALALLSAPASADVPAGWGEQTEHQGLDALHTLGLFLGAPLLLVVLIAVAVYLPAMIRGDKLLPDHSAGEAQWIGGPRQGVAELPAPDGADSRAGGASGSW